MTRPNNKKMNFSKKLFLFFIICVEFLKLPIKELLLLTQVTWTKSQSY